MYHKFYGLTESPFDLTPNPRYLFLSPSHAEALAMLRYATSGHGGLTLLVGEAGTGKTTLVYAALGAHQADAGTTGPSGATPLRVFVTNPALTRDEFIELLASEFGLSPEVGASKTRFLRELVDVLKTRRAAGLPAALIVDEAQCLSDALLEEIRLLGNIETATEKLLSIILIGQPELADRLNATALRQLKQRVGLRCSLRPLNLAETAAYIATRIQVAGGEVAAIFSPRSIELVHHASTGIPRIVGVLCENALVSGFALKQRPIDYEVIVDICSDLALPLPPDARSVAESQAPTPVASTFF
jgi:general secretion pathway protein A